MLKKKQRRKKLDSKVPQLRYHALEVSRPLEKLEVPSCEPHGCHERKRFHLRNCVGSFSPEKWPEGLNLKKIDGKSRLKIEKLKMKYHWMETYWNTTVHQKSKHEDEIDFEAQTKNHSKIKSTSPLLPPATKRSLATQTAQTMILGPSVPKAPRRPSMAWERRPERGVCQNLMCCTPKVAKSIGNSLDPGAAHKPQRAPPL